MRENTKTNKENALPYDENISAIEIVGFFPEVVTFEHVNLGRSLFESCIKNR